MLDNKRQLLFETIAIKGNVGYASAYNKNGLYEVDLVSGDCRFLCNFDETVDLKRIHSKAVWIKNKVYFIPGSGDRVSVYNIDDHTLDSIMIPTASSDGYNKNLKFIDAVNQGSFLWLIPSTYPGIIRLDLNTMALYTFDSWLPEEGIYLRAGACIEGDTVIIPNGRNNMVFKINLTNQSSETIRVGKNNNGTICMKKIGAYYYLAPLHPGSIIKWNPSNGSIGEYGDYPKGFSAGRFVFSDILSFDDRVAFAPLYSNMGIILKDDALKQDNTEWKKNDKNCLMKMLETNRCVYYYEFRQNRYIKMEIGSGRVSEVNFTVLNPDEDLKRSLEKAVERKDVIYESGIFGLNELLESI